jgi:hypothetical protein
VFVCVCVLSWRVWAVDMRGQWAAQYRLVCYRLMTRSTTTNQQCHSKAMHAQVRHHSTLMRDTMLDA